MPSLKLYLAQTLKLGHFWRMIEVVPLLIYFFFSLRVSPKRSFVGSLEAIMSPGQKGKDAILIKVDRFTIHIGFKTSPVCADRGRSTGDKNDLC